jgi:hypothetical protein
MSINAVPGDKFIETTVEQHRKVNSWVDENLSQIEFDESGVALF